MKMVYQALFFAFVLHLIYYIGMLMLGYVLTITYEPNLERAWDKTAYLQNEVAFGSAHSSWFYLMTFLAAAFICFTILHIHKRWFK